MEQLAQEAVAALSELYATTAESLEMKEYLIPKEAIDKLNSVVASQNKAQIEQYISFTKMLTNSLKN